MGGIAERGRAYFSLVCKHSIHSLVSTGGGPAGTDTNPLPPPYRAAEVRICKCRLPTYPPHLPQVYAVFFFLHFSRATPLPLPPFLFPGSPYKPAAKNSRPIATEGVLLPRTWAWVHRVGYQERSGRGGQHRMWGISVAGAPQESWHWSRARAREGRGYFGPPTSTKVCHPEVRSGAAPIRYTGLSVAQVGLRVSSGVRGERTGPAAGKTRRTLSTGLADPLSRGRTTGGHRGRPGSL